MKARVVTREEMKVEAFIECREDYTWQAAAAMLYAFHLAGYRKKRIKRVFNMLKAVYEMPPILGKELCGNDVMDFLKEKYDVDVKEINVKTEAERKLREKAKHK